MPMTFSARSPIATSSSGSNISAANLQPVVATGLKPFTPAVTPPTPTPTFAPVVATPLRPAPAPTFAPVVATPLRPAPAPTFTPIVVQPIKVIPPQPTCNAGYVAVLRRPPQGNPYWECVQDVYAEGEVDSSASTNQDIQDVVDQGVDAGGGEPSAPVCPEGSYYDTNYAACVASDAYLPADMVSTPSAGPLGIPLWGWGVGAAVVLAAGYMLFGRGK
jgi:hypothetical protein